MRGKKSWYLPKKSRRNELLHFLHVEEHQTCFELYGWFSFAVVYVAILLLLLLGGEEEVKSTTLIELDEARLV